MSWQPVESRVIYRSSLLELRSERVRMPDGKVVQREVVDHPGAVVVLAVTDDGRIPFVRQYRHAAGEYLLELVAGTLEPGEDPAATAQRELQEEAGYAAGRLTKLGEYYSAPGFCTELLHLYLAEQLVPARLPGDEDEAITVELLYPADALALAAGGKLRDAKTLAGLLIYAAQNGLR
jgi:ADP-ribose pyrophosphatase